MSQDDIDWKAEMEQRLADVTLSLESTKGDIKGIEGRIDFLTQGVANFRAFQNDSREFYSEQRAYRAAREQLEKDTAADKALRDAGLELRKWKRSDKIALAAVLAVVILPPVGWTTAQAVNFFGDLYRITQEWHEVHKSELTPKKKSMFDLPVNNEQALHRTVGSISATPR